MSRIFSFIAAAFVAALLVAGPIWARVPVPSASRGHGNSPPPAVGWPQMMRDAAHSSYSTDKLINAQSAPTLGINWMSPMRAAALSSPVSAYNAALGKVVVYVGTERGDVIAYDESNGTTLWSTSVGFGDSMRASPMVAPDGTVWVATAYGSTLYKLDGTTGKVDCAVKEKIRFNASPMFATPKGGVPSVFISTNDVGNISGVTVAINEQTCKTIWSFNDFVTFAGAWATAAYGVDETGQPLIFFGTADPDSTEYAVNAVTGKRVWYFSIQNPPPGTYDIGAATTVSAPGVNGFADGAVYVPSKYGIMYALDMHTGKLIWQYNFNKNAHTVEGGRSAAALVGRSLVFGMANGVYSLDAKTGSKLWNYVDPAQQEVISSPSIQGPTGSEVVGFGDVTGAIHFLRLSDGKPLYNYQTSNYITSSPAVIQGHFIIASTDGFLYDLMAGGGNVAQGTTAIASPATGSTVPNPQGNLTVTGSSTDNALVTEVLVSVQAGGPTGPWWDAATGQWVKGAVNNFVAVQSPQQKQTNWTFQFPVPSSGSTYQVFANTVDLQGQVDRVGAQTSFAVKPDPSLPQIVPSTFIAPPTGAFKVAGSGFAPNETVGFSLQGTEVGKAQADGNGNVPSTNITVPAKASFGESALVGTGRTSNKSTTAPIDVTNIWADAGFGASRNGYEPNDNVLAHTLQATRHGYLARAWLFTSGAAVNSSPAIYAGSAYFGNDAGQFYSIDTASGAPFWSYTTPTGKPIHASATTDGSIVVFGSDDGSLYTLSAATGTLVGSTSLDGIPTAPALSGNSIYTATDNGSVYDVDKTTGNVIWKISVGAAVHAAPAVDLANGTVAVGDDSGAVTVLNGTTGAKVYGETTGGAVATAPAFQSGALFVGSTNGTFYAFDAKTGTPTFTYKAGAPIHAFAANPKGEYVGSDDGSVALIDATHGKVTYKLSFGTGAIVGIGASMGVPLVEQANGNIGAIKDDQARVLFSYQTPGTLSTQPAIVDGTVFVGAGDTSLYAFTSYGRAPVDAKERRLLANLRKHAVAPARWTAISHPTSGVATRAFEPNGPRDFPMHLDRARFTPAAGNVTAHGGPVQRAPRGYLIYWSPGRAALGDAGSPAQALRRGANLAGTAVDASPYPRALDDAAVQREIAREIALNRWTVDANAQVFVVTGAGKSASSAGYCAYHSAFHPGGNLAIPLPYAFVPYPDAGSGCGALSPLLTREQAEMRTDPLLNGWHDANGNESTK